MVSPQLVHHYKNLKTSFDANDLKKCGTLLTQLKVGLSETGLLPVVASPNPNTDELLFIRDILEIGALHSIRNRDVPSFVRYFAQLQTFYIDYATILPPSSRKDPLLGLNLIYLLTEGRIAEFHITLESLRMASGDAVEENPFIKHPVNVERWLMEGSYSKVWNAREEAPAAEYKFFVESLMGTIRNEIASCEELAYDMLPLKDAGTLLFFTNRNDLLKFAQQRGWQINLTEETITFVTKSEEKFEIPKAKLIAANLTYARELEQIV